eukprot:1774705-Pleurochrysis_carterae.AAC.1
MQLIASDPTAPAPRASPAAAGRDGGSARTRSSGSRRRSKPSRQKERRGVKMPEYSNLCPARSAIFKLSLHESDLRAREFFTEVLRGPSLRALTFCSHVSVTTSVSAIGPYVSRCNTTPALW